MKIQKKLLLCAMFSSLPLIAIAGESGSSHSLPGSTATLIDMPPSAPGSFLKAMYLNYNGDASAITPTAAGLVADLDVSINTFVFGGGHTFDKTIFGGAHYTVAAFLPYSWIDLSGEVQLQNGPVSRSTSVNGLGDLTIVPIMLAWKTGEWQIDTMLPIFVPTGSYELGRLGNTSLNYWTYDPNVGVAFNGKSGLNAMFRAGYSINTENPDTHYKSGSIMHFEATLEQLIPVGKGVFALGAEAFYFDQVTCDSGSGATLGCFKGMTSGIGPVLGYIKPMGKQALVLELKWLAELDTKNRLEGDYIWLKGVYKF